MAGIPQAERHGQVAEGSKWCDEGSLQPIGRAQLDLRYPEYASTKLNSLHPAVESITWLILGGAKVSLGQALLRLV